MAVVLHQHDCTVNRALCRHNQGKISAMDPETAHGIIRGHEVEDFIRRSAFDPVIGDGQQTIIHRLHHRVHHRHTLQHALKGVKPHAAGDGLILFFHGFGGGYFDGLRLRTAFLSATFPLGSLSELRRNLSQIDGCGYIIQGKVSLGLLTQADSFQNASGLIICDDAGAGLNSLQITLADTTFPGYLLQCQLLTQPLSTDQISQTAHVLASFALISRRSASACFTFYCFSNSRSC